LELNESTECSKHYNIHDINTQDFFKQMNRLWNEECL
jgi:hypothetical protein